MGRVPDEARLLPVTVRFTQAEINRLRGEATRSGVTFSQLARERLGDTTGAGRPQASLFADALDALDERVRVLEQLANRDY